MKTIIFKAISIVLIAFCSLNLAFAQNKQSTETVSEISQKRKNLVSYCMEFLGTPYLDGGTTKKGMDCSGFVFTCVMDSTKIPMQRTAKNIQRTSKKISRDELVPGDFVFFITSGINTNHVGIYIGDNNFIHCASSGSKTGVIISNLDEKYWKKAYSGAGKIIMD